METLRKEAINVISKMPDSASIDDINLAIKKPKL